MHRPQQAAHRDLDLELREHRADAEMPPGAECEVVGGGAERAVAVEVSAVHVEPVGLREAALVAVGRAEEAQHLGVGRDLTAADLNGAAGATRDHVRRRGVAHRLGEGAAHQLGPLAQLGELLGVGDEVAHEGGERLLYRFAAGEDHQHAEADDLVVAELLAVDLAVSKHREQARAGAAAVRCDDRVQVGVERVACAQSRAGDLGVADEIEAEAQQRGVPGAELVPVLRRHAEDRGEHADRVGGDELGDEFDFASFAKAGDESLGVRGDCRSERRADVLDAKRRGEQAALACVVGAVELDDRQAQERLELRRVTLRRELGAGGGEANVVVAAQSVEVVLRVVVDGRFVTKAAPDRVRIGVDRPTGRSRAR